MVIILEEGEIPTYTKTCKYCRTRWSFQPEDLVDGKAICPKCKHPSGMQGTVAKKRLTPPEDPFDDLPWNQVAK
jgi:hypothetical protein